MMDEVRRIVGSGGLYYTSSIWKARNAMENGFYYNPGKHFKKVMEKCGLDHVYRTELFTSLDNPQFYLLDLRFDADIPDSSVIESKSKTNPVSMATTSLCSQDEKSNRNISIMDPTSSPLSPENHSTIKTKLTSSCSSSTYLEKEHSVYSSESSLGQDKQHPIPVSSSDDVDDDEEDSDEIDNKVKAYNEKNVNSAVLDESSKSSLEEGELDFDDGELDINDGELDFDDEDALSGPDRLSSNMTNVCKTNHSTNIQINDNCSKKRKFSDIQNGNMVGFNTYNSSSPVDNNSNPALETVDCFQCELCGAMKNCQNEMNEHLKSAEHFSASKVRGTFNMGHIESIVVVRESCLRNSAALYKTLVPMCPMCYKIFPTIYDCALHFSITHNSNVKDCYSVGRVTREERISNFSNNICGHCKKEFLKPYQLGQHWRSSLHWPFPTPKKTEISVFLCPLCNKLTYDFINMVNHIQSKHVIDDKQDHYVLVRFIEKSSKFLKVLPPVSKDQQKRPDCEKIRSFGLKEKFYLGSDRTGYRKESCLNWVNRKRHKRKQRNKKLKTDKSVDSFVTVH